jgi:hypothetical protein
MAHLTRRQVRDAWVPVVALAALLPCAWFDARQSALLGSYQIGLELLVINGALIFAGLWLLSRPAAGSQAHSASSVAR